MRRLAVLLVSLALFGCGAAPEVAAAADAGEAAPPSSDPPAASEPAPSEPPEETSPPPPEEITPDAGAKTTLRIMSFNIKHGEVVGHDLSKLAASIAPSNPDVLALQEVDEGTTRSGGLRETEAIAKAMGMPHFFFGKNFDYDGGAYGLAIVSKYPLSNTRVIRLDAHTRRADGYEPRIAAAADVVVAGKTIAVLSVHASLHAEERPGNGEAIVKALGASAPGAIVMGDFNEVPGSAIGAALVGAGLVDAFHERHPTARGYTSPATSPVRRIDFLFRGSSFGATKHAWVPDVRTSDHRPVAAVVPLPP